MTEEAFRPITGWGRTAPTTARVLVPTTAAEAARGVAAAGARGVVARGLGRSYGDAAQNGGGDVVDLTAVASLLDMDLAHGAVTVAAGASLDRLMRTFLPLGWFVPVSPGTRHVTVGGAIAADIHGKNHHRDGSLGSHVEELELSTPVGTMTLAPSVDPEAFWATVGGMGLTGVILSARLRLLRVETSLVRVDTERAPDLDAVMALMAEGDDRYRYSVAWIDCLARGRRMGRGVLTRGDHATLDEVPAHARRDPLGFNPRPLVAAPPVVPGGLVNRFSMAAFNEAWYRRAPRHEEGALESIAAFFHPLDGVSGWNRMYGAAGFLQYQVAVPMGAEDTVRRLVEAFSSSGTPSFLTVLKRFGPGNPAPLSFPIGGWTLALDIPAGVPGLGRMLDGLDQEVAAAGGRVYLAKDSRLRADILPSMYPRLDEWRAVRSRLDPRGQMQSDLSRRLGLAG